MNENTLECSQIDSQDEDSEDDQIWEQVNPLEIIIPSKSSTTKITKITKQDRLLRQHIHKTHLLCLLSCCSLWNKWSNNQNLHAFCISTAPKELTINPHSKLFINQLKTLFKHTQSKHTITPAFQTSINGPDHLINILSNTTSITPNESALLFLATCRALSINARLVCSIHPISLSFSNKSLKQSYPIEIASEIYSNHLSQWIPVHPTKGIISEAKNCPTVFSQETVSYVLAFESAFGIKDITKKYTNQWDAKTKKRRLKNESEDWWNMILLYYSKGWNDIKDVNEDIQITNSEISQAMPSSLSGFLNHPLYALEKQCKQNEVIYPSGAKYSIGKFKKDLVYPRSLVKELHSRNGWLRFGKSVKNDENAIKINTPQRKKQKTSSFSSKSDNNDENGDLHDDSKNSKELFGEWQTVPFVPLPVISGKIPRNSFGNIELFHDNMLPAGTVHLETPGIGNVAKFLGIDFARAVVGFDYYRGKGTPRIHGIVVESEYKEILENAHAEKARLLESAERESREKRVSGRWAKMTAGLLNLDRLRKAYL